MRGWKRSIGEITACFEEDLYLESQLRHKFSGRRSKLFHVSCQLVATKAVGACHHKLIAGHCLKPPVKQNARLLGLKLTRSSAIPESCHLSKGIATEKQNQSHLKHQFTLKYNTGRSKETVTCNISLAEPKKVETAQTQ